MSTAERRSHVNPLEINWPHSKRFAFKSEGDTILLDNTLAIKFIINRRGTSQRGEFVLAARKPHRLIRQISLAKGKTNFPVSDGLINFLKTEIRKNPTTNVLVGPDFSDYRLSFDRKAHGKVIILVESQKPVHAEFLKGVATLAPLFEESNRKESGPETG